MSERLRPPAAPRPPDKARFIDPRNEPALEAYLRSVFRWHGYIQFVSVASVRENPDIPIARLFIEPYLANQWVSTDILEGKWPKSELLMAAVVQYPRLVVLGDPGSGKSTLVSWLAWQLARRKDTPWIPTLNGLVPIPIILRELGIVTGITWENLLMSFLEREMAEPIAKARNLFNRMLASGQAYLLFDGLDEIGSLEARRSQRDAIFEGMHRFPACRWILTSRIVGYEEVTFHHVDGTIARTDPTSWSSATSSSSLDEWDMRRWFALFPPNRPDSPRAARRIAQLAYVTPFKR
jgi:internalin A